MGRQRRSWESRTARVCALLSLALLAACQDPNAIGLQVYGTVTGTALNSTNNQPIAGALVRAADREARTDSEGRFTLVQIPIGSQTVTIYAAGFTNLAQSIAVTANANTQLNYVYLRAAAADRANTGSLTGTVVNAKTNQPVGGALVSVADQVTQTNASGQFVLDAVVVGKQTLSVTATGYQPSSTPVQVVLGRATAIATITLTPSS